MVLVHTDLPEPVVPAISKWGSLLMSPTMACPLISLPTAKDVLDLLLVKAVEPITEWMLTGETTLLGTSMPTTEILSGMGAMRTPAAPRARAMSSARLVSLFSLTPWSSSSSYRVTDGPLTTLMMLALIPKEWMVSPNRWRLALSSPRASPPISPPLSRSRDKGGYW